MARTAGKTTGKLSALKIDRAKRPGMLGDGNGLVPEGRRRRIEIMGAALQGARSLQKIRPWPGSYRGSGAGAAEGRRCPPPAARRQRPHRTEDAPPRPPRCWSPPSRSRSTSAPRYIETNKAQWRNERHADQWGKSLQRYASPVFGHLAVADVDVGLVVQALQKIWTTKPATASRVRGRIEVVLNYAKAQGFRSGENAAALKGNLDHILPKHTATIKNVQHHPAMPHRDVPALMTTLRQRDEIAAHALAFAILTAARRSEVIWARWDEVDFDAKIWTVPGSRMKSGREHRVPLSDAAIDLLRQMQEIGRQHDAPEFVFPSSVKRGKPTAETGMALMLQRLGHDDISLHGFRSQLPRFRIRDDQCAA